MRKLDTGAPFDNFLQISHIEFEEKKVEEAAEAYDTPKGLTVKNEKADGKAVQNISAAALASQIGPNNQLPKQIADTQNAGFQPVVLLKRLEDIYSQAELRRALLGKNISDIKEVKEQHLASNSCSPEKKYRRILSHDQLADRIKTQKRKLPGHDDKLCKKQRLSPEVKIKKSTVKPSLRGQSRSLFDEFGLIKDQKLVLSNSNENEKEYTKPRSKPSLTTSENAVSALRGALDIIKKRTEHDKKLSDKTKSLFTKASTKERGSAKDGGKDLHIQNIENEACVVFSDVCDIYQHNRLQAVHKQESIKHTDNPSLMTNAIVKSEQKIKSLAEKSTGHIRLPLNNTKGLPINACPKSVCNINTEEKEERISKNSVFYDKGTSRDVTSVINTSLEKNVTSKENSLTNHERNANVKVQPPIASERSIPTTNQSSLPVSNGCSVKTSVTGTSKDASEKHRSRTEKRVHKDKNSSKTTISHASEGTENCPSKVILASGVQQTSSDSGIESKKLAQSNVKDGNVHITNTSGGKVRRLTGESEKLQQNGIKLDAIIKQVANGKTSEQRQSLNRDDTKGDKCLSEKKVSSSFSDANSCNKTPSHNSERRRSVSGGLKSSAISEDKRRPSTAGGERKTLTSTDVKKLSASEDGRKSFSSVNDRRPSVASSDRSSTLSTDRPFALVSEKKLCKSSSERKACTSISERVSSGEHRPTASSGERGPSASSGERGPAASSGERRPPASSGERRPSASSGERRPSASSGERRPSAFSGERRPSASSGERWPSASSGERRPSTSSGERRPSASSGEKRPSASSSERRPSASSSERRPSASSDEKRPLASSDGNRPLASSEGKRPLASSEEGKRPLASSEEGKRPLASSEEGKRPLASSEEGKRPLASSEEGKRPLASSEEGKRPLASSEEGKRPLASSEEGKRPLASSEEGKRPLASSEEGKRPLASSSEGKRPLASSSEGKRPLASSSEGKRPLASSEVKRPLASSEGKRPLASSEGKRPLASSEGKRRLASSEGKRPLASSEGKRPLASSEGKRPLASSEGKRPLASSEGKKRPVASSEGKKRPLASSEEKRSLALTAEKRPLALTEEKRPVASSEEKRPVASSEEKRPVASSEEKRPVASSEEKRPVASSEEKRPVASAEEKRPVASSDEWSSVSSGENKPHSSSSERRPSSEKRSSTENRRPSGDEGQITEGEKKVAITSIEKRATVDAKKLSAARGERRPSFSGDRNGMGSGGEKRYPTSAIQKKPLNSKEKLNTNSDQKSPVKVSDCNRTSHSNDNPTQKSKADASKTSLPEGKTKVKTSTSGYEFGKEKHVPMPKAAIINTKNEPDKLAQETDSKSEHIQYTKVKRKLSDDFALNKEKFPRHTGQKEHFPLKLQSNADRTQPVIKSPSHTHDRIQQPIKSLRDVGKKDPLLKSVHPCIDKADSLAPFSGKVCETVASPQVEGAKFVISSTHPEIPTLPKKSPGRSEDKPQLPHLGEKASLYSNLPHADDKVQSLKSNHHLKQSNNKTQYVSKLQRSSDEKTSPLKSPSHLEDGTHVKSPCHSRKTQSTKIDDSKVKTESYSSGKVKSARLSKEIGKLPVNDDKIKKLKSHCDEEYLAQHLCTNREALKPFQSTDVSVSKSGEIPHMMKSSIVINKPECKNETSVQNPSNSADGKNLEKEKPFYSTGKAKLQAGFGRILADLSKKKRSLSSAEKPKDAVDVAEGGNVVALAPNSKRDLEASKEKSTESSSSANNKETVQLPEAVETGVDGESVTLVSNSKGDLHSSTEKSRPAEGSSSANNKATVQLPESAKTREFQENCTQLISNEENSIKACDVTGDNTLAAVSRIQTDDADSVHNRGSTVSKISQIRDEPENVSPPGDLVLPVADCSNNPNQPKMSIGINDCDAIPGAPKAYSSTMTLSSDSVGCEHSSVSCSSTSERIEVSYTTRDSLLSAGATSDDDQVGLMEKVTYPDVEGVSSDSLGMDATNVYGVPEGAILDTEDNDLGLMIADVRGQAADMFETFDSHDASDENCLVDNVSEVTEQTEVQTSNPVSGTSSMSETTLQPQSELSVTQPSSLQADHTTPVKSECPSPGPSPSKYNDKILEPLYSLLDEVEKETDDITVDDDCIVVVAGNKLESKESLSKRKFVQQFLPDSSDDDSVDGELVIDTLRSDSQEVELPQGTINSTTDSMPSIMQLCASLKHDTRSSLSLSAKEPKPPPEWKLQKITNLQVRRHSLTRRPSGSWNDGRSFSTKGTTTDDPSFATKVVTEQSITVGPSKDLIDPRLNRVHANDEPQKTLDVKGRLPIKRLSEDGNEDSTAKKAREEITRNNMILDMPSFTRDCIPSVIQYRDAEHTKAKGTKTASFKSRSEIHSNTACHKTGNAGQNSVEDAVDGSENKSLSRRSSVDFAVPLDRQTDCLPKTLCKSTLSTKGTTTANLPLSEKSSVQSHPPLDRTCSQTEKLKRLKNQLEEWKQDEPHHANSATESDAAAAPVHAEDLVQTALDAAFQDTDSSEGKKAEDEVQQQKLKSMPKKLQRGKTDPAQKLKTMMAVQDIVDQARESRLAQELPGYNWLEAKIKSGDMAAKPHTPRKVVPPERKLTPPASTPIPRLSSPQRGDVGTGQEFQSSTVASSAPLRHVLPKPTPTASAPVTENTATNSAISGPVAAIAYPNVVAVPGGQIAVSATQASSVISATNIVVNANSVPATQPVTKVQQTQSLLTGERQYLQTSAIPPVARNPIQPTVSYTPITIPVSEAFLIPTLTLQPPQPSRIVIAPLNTSTHAFTASPLISVSPFSQISPPLKHATATQPLPITTMFSQVQLVNPQPIYLNTVASLQVQPATTVTTVASTKPLIQAPRISNNCSISKTLSASGEQETWNVRNLISARIRGSQPIFSEPNATPVSASSIPAATDNSAQSSTLTTNSAAVKMSASEIASTTTNSLSALVHTEETLIPVSSVHSPILVNLEPPNSSISSSVSDAVNAVESRTQVKNQSVHHSQSTPRTLGADRMTDAARPIWNPVDVPLCNTSEINVNHATSDLATTANHLTDTVTTVKQTSVSASNISLVRSNSTSSVVIPNPQYSATQTLQTFVNNMESNTTHHPPAYQQQANDSSTTHPRRMSQTPTTDPVREDFVTDSSKGDVICIDIPLTDQASSQTHSSVRVRRSLTPQEIQRLNDQTASQPPLLNVGNAVRPNGTAVAQSQHIEQRQVTQGWLPSSTTANQYSSSSQIPVNGSPNVTQHPLAAKSYEEKHNSNTESVAERHPPQNDRNRLQDAGSVQQFLPQQNSLCDQPVGTRESLPNRTCPAFTITPQSYLALQNTFTETTAAPKKSEHLPPPTTDTRPRVVPPIRAVAKSQSLTDLDSKNPQQLDKEMETRKTELMELERLARAIDEDRMKVLDMMREKEGQLKEMEQTMQHPIASVSSAQPTHSVRHNPPPYPGQSSTHVESRKRSGEPVEHSIPEKRAAHASNQSAQPVYIVPTQNGFVRSEGPPQYQLPSQQIAVPSRPSLTNNSSMVDLNGQQSALEKKGLYEARLAAHKFQEAARLQAEKSWLQPSDPFMQQARLQAKAQMEAEARQHAQMESQTQVAARAQAKALTQATRPVPHNELHTQAQRDKAQTHAMQSTLSSGPHEMYRTVRPTTTTSQSSCATCMKVTGSNRCWMHSDSNASLTPTGGGQNASPVVTSAQTVAVRHQTTTLMYATNQVVENRIESSSHLGQLANVVASAGSPGHRDPYNRNVAMPQSTMVPVQQRRPHQTVTSYQQVPPNRSIHQNSASSDEMRRHSLMLSQDSQRQLQPSQLQLQQMSLRQQHYPLAAQQQHPQQQHPQHLQQQQQQHPQHLQQQQQQQVQQHHQHPFQQEFHMSHQQQQQLQLQYQQRQHTFQHQQQTLSEVGSNQQQLPAPVAVRHLHSGPHLTEGPFETVRAANRLPHAPVPTYPAVSGQNSVPTQLQQTQDSLSANPASQVVSHTADSADNVELRCHYCNQHASFMCSECKQAWYCKMECQVVDWPRHSQFCRLGKGK